MVRITTSLGDEAIKTLRPMSVYRDAKALSHLGMAKRNTRKDYEGDSESYKELGLDLPPENGDSRIPGVATAAGRFIKRSIRDSLVQKRETPDVGGKARSLRQSPPHPHLLLINPSEIYRGPYKPVAPGGVDDSWYVGPDPSLKARIKSNKENKKPEVANDDSHQDQEPLPEISTNIEAPTLSEEPVTFVPKVAQEAEVLPDGLDIQLKKLPLKLAHMYSKKPALLLQAKPLLQAPRLLLCPENIDGEAIDIETLNPSGGFRLLLPSRLHKPRLC
ncbi:hypothetical protein [Escherichia coli]|uniref:hypothetical protein n=1 Tax=Escherichia coli TaxID=562 RepID=UPI0030795150